MTFQRYVERVDRAMRHALDGASDVTLVVQADTDGPAQATWSRGGLVARARATDPVHVTFSYGLTEDPEIEAEDGNLHELTVTDADLLGARELAVLFAHPSG